MESASFSIEESTDNALRQGIDQHLEAYNADFAPPYDLLPLLLVARDVSGELCGGLVGATFWGWLHIDTLWVASEWRGQGVGKALLQHAEMRARERQCHSVQVETHDFQAPDFYRKLGYVCFGTLNDFPEGHVKYFLKKRLVEKL
jgi:ribosomal protein S18 acetylase RimI-like enzyme